jgi:hypothetical protein
MLYGGRKGGVNCYGSKESSHREEAYGKKACGEKSPG